MTEFTKEDIEYYRKQYALWTSRRQTTPEELHLIGRLRDALDHIEHLYQRIEELEKERRWIPVSERLPDFLTPTLTVYRTKTGISAITLRYRLDEYFWIDEEGNKVPKKNVTHWMPLPLPPEEK